MAESQQAFRHYLDAYARKDLDAIAAMLAEEVRLRDWNLAVQGKAAVLAETAKNFASVSSIAIELLSLHESAQGVAGELRIRVDEKLELFVVDVIDFDEQGRITAIRAYKGRGDEDESGSSA